VTCAARLAAALAAWVAFGGLAHAQTYTYAGRSEVEAFIAEMVERHAFARPDLERLLASARHQAAVVAAMAPVPSGARSWRLYRANFVSPRRIEAGVRFWRMHSAALDRAEQAYGVPPEIVVAIIGVETEYGRNQGGFRVLDALATLAFDYPRRADYFRTELEQYLLLARETRLDAAAVKGSFAGAIGIPQFMPGSVRRFAVDFDGDGRHDLRGSAADAIGSVANFLAEHGWVGGAPVAVPARIEDERALGLVDGGIVPVHRPDVLREFGVAFDREIAVEAPGVLVELESPDGPPEYLVGLQNFYAITRYNRSSFYAAAVVELAEAVKSKRRDEGKERKGDG
jgi:membrane-bound lytic murein transglycosylase B